MLIFVDCFLVRPTEIRCLVQRANLIGFSLTEAPDAANIK